MIINNSRIETFEQCPREYLLRYEYGGYGIQPQVLPSPLGDGLSIHAGLGEWYTTSDLARASKALLAQYDDNFQKSFGMAAHLSPTAAKAKTWGNDLLEAYVYRAEPVDDFKVLEVEVEFNVVLGEICWACGVPYSVVPSDVAVCPSCKVASVHRLVGRADLVVERGGGIKVVDHKTAKSVSASYLDSYEHSMQLIGYAYGISKQNNFRVNGYGVNILKKLQHLKPYDVACTSCAGTGLTAKKKLMCSKCSGKGSIEKQPSQLFIRQWYSCGPDKTDRFVHNRLQTINRIEGELKKWNSTDPNVKMDAFPPNRRACHNPLKGAEGCAFIPLCWWGRYNPDKWWSDIEMRAHGMFKENVPDYVNLAQEEVR